MLRPPFSNKFEALAHGSEVVLRVAVIIEVETLFLLVVYLVEGE